MRLLRHIEKVPRFKRARHAKALIDAMQYGDEDLALWLLKQGCDPHAKDHKGRSALWWAAALCKTSVIRELIRRGATLPEDVLMGPVSAGDMETVRLLVRRGANVNCVASEYSPVGHLNIKQVLLSAALGVAAVGPQVEAIPIMLIRAGAQVNRRVLPRPFPGRQDRSMLGLAAYLGLCRTVQAMIAAGADVSLRDNRGRTALFDAVEQGHLSVARELLRAGARTDIKDSTGLTALEALRRQKQSPEMLLTEFRISHGINVDKAELDAQAGHWDRQRARLVALLQRHERSSQQK
jgi:ankyrin repeat protein